MRRSPSIGTYGLALAAMLGACDGGSARTPPSEWWRDRVVYEVFVRSFADSDGDGVGALAGLTAHLDDLNDGDPATVTDLGVEALWLMPIFPSPSYHGYDVTDYRSVRTQYGALSDLDALVAAAHARGMRVILDMVLNHSSSSHPWFVDSASGPSAARRGWYVWSPTDLGWRRPWDNAVAWYPLNGAYYWGIFTSSMPDLNLANAQVEQELVDTMRFWLARGVDGFRLDAIRHYFESATGVVVDQPESHAFLKRIRAALQLEYPDVLLAGEAWAPVETQVAYFGDGDEVQLAFSFDVSDAVRASIVAGSSDALVNAVARAETALAGKDRGFEAPFLSNHDQIRVMRQLGGDAAAARVAAATLLALPGTPFVYYGEEIGMQGGSGADDRQKRAPMRWNATAPGYGFTSASFVWCLASCGEGEAPGVDVATQRADTGSLWNLYRRLIGLRRARKALSRGEAIRPPVGNGGPGVFALLRTAEGKRVLFVANLAPAAAAAFDVDVSGTPAVLESEGLAGTPTSGAGKVQVPGLAARSFAFLSLD